MIGRIGSNGYGQWWLWSAALLVVAVACAGGGSKNSDTSGGTGQGGSGGGGASSGTTSPGGSSNTGSTSLTGGTGTTTTGNSGTVGSTAGSTNVGGSAGAGSETTGGTAGSVGSSVDFVFPEPGSSITRPFQGTLTINTVQDMLSFCASYDGVRGSVHVYGADIVNLDELSCLVEVTGPLELEAPNLVLANLPNLVALGTLFAATPSKLVEFDMPLLRTVTNEIRITAPALPGIALPALQGVGDGLVIASITPLLSVELPELLWVGAEANLVSSQLKEVNLGKLQHLGGDLQLPPSLEHLSLHDIVEAGSVSIPGGSYADIDVSGLVNPTSLSLLGNALSTELVELLLPNLESASGVHVSGFPNLTSIDLPALTSTDNFTVLDNPLLETVSAPGIVDCSWLQLEFAGDPALPNLETGSYIRFNLAEVGDLTLPKLRQVETELNVFGAVVVSLPELGQVNALTVGRYLSAEATVGTELSLPFLTTARTLHIAEGVELLDMPALESFDSLTITNTWLSDISLDFANAGIIDTRGNPDLTSIEFPALTSAQRLVIGDAPLLDSLSVPVLEQVVENLSFTEIPLLVSVSLPELQTLGNLSFSLTRSANSLSAPKLASLGQLSLFYSGFTDFSLPSLTLLSDQLRVTNNATLQTLSLPAALGTSANGISVMDNPALQTFEAPEIDWGGAVIISNNPALPGFDLSGMTRATSISVTNNALLTSLAGFSSLDLVGDITIYDNPLLTGGAVDSFVASITTVNGDVVLTAP